MKQTRIARKYEGAKAEQLFNSAYEGYANVVKKDLTLSEALYNWGFALFHQAKTKQGNEAVNLYKSAIEKFTFCQLISPDHLGAAIDGGVADMDLARAIGVGPKDVLYENATKQFTTAERIQRGSAAYNLACIYGLRGQENEAQKALEFSKECGSLPEVDGIINDADLIKIKQTQWFEDFIESITAEAEKTEVEAVQVDKEDERLTTENKQADNPIESEIDSQDSESEVVNIESVEDKENIVAAVTDAKFESLHYSEEVK